MTRFAVVLAVLSGVVAWFDPAGTRPAALGALTLAVVLLGVRIAGAARARRRRRTLEGLRALPPAEFEAEVARWLRRDGWRVEQRGGTGDGGIDLVATRREAKLAVQCKRYAETAAVSSAQVRDLYGAAIALEATVAVLVTTGRISAQALAWGEALPGSLPVRVHDHRCLALLAAGAARV